MRPIRWAFALMIGSVATLAAFGLLVALAWWPPFAVHITYKLVTAVLAANLSFVAGGFVAGRLGGSGGVIHGAVLGLLFGFYAFSYLFGPHWVVLITGPAAGLLGALGGRLAEQSLARRA